MSGSLLHILRAPSAVRILLCSFLRVKIRRLLCDCLCDSFGLLGLIAVSVGVAYAAALCLHKVNVCAKCFGPTFKHENASATAIKTLSFFMFLL